MMDQIAGLGATNGLPIAAFHNEIITTVATNQAVIITAETGAGKSTQVPKYLLAAGYNLVVTQPRILAARTVAERVAFEIGEPLGQTIGVRSSRDKIGSDATRCLFATDGLAMIRELLGYAKSNTVLVIDEVHEWNLNIEVLVAYAKQRMTQDPNFKVVLMSATLEAEKLAAFFNNAPIIRVPGRVYPVTVRNAGFSVAADVAQLVREGRNVLVFQPGKSEITQFIDKLREKKVPAEILPLHGEVDHAGQRACFEEYGRPKVIVATNIAQTSVTIPGIDAVVDSGVERRVEIVNGIEGLYIKPISFADAEQRKGRAGRTKPGLYIDHCAADDADRLPFPQAEILRTRLDQTVLRLAVAGFDAEALEFFHQPVRKDIHAAKHALKALGLMDETGKVTNKGHIVSKLPVSVEAACMILEADQRGVVDDVLTIAAILEVGGITFTTRERGEVFTPWRTLCRNEKTSDVLAQLAVFRAVPGLSKDTTWRDAGIHVKNYQRALEVRRQLAEAVKRTNIRFGTTGNREDILLSVCTGMASHLYRYEYGRGFRNDEADEARNLNHDSIMPHNTPWVVGKPMDLEIMTREGKRLRRFINLATAVKPEWLIVIAPQHIREDTGLTPRYDETRDEVVSTTNVYFKDELVGTFEEADPTHPEAANVFAAWVAQQMLQTS